MVQMTKSSRCCRHWLRTEHVMSHETLFEHWWSSLWVRMGVTRHQRVKSNRPFGSILFALSEVTPHCAQFSQALTTPLARLPGIARNDRRATIFVGRSCPQKTFSCVNQLLTHCTSYALLILRGVLQSDCYLVLNQLLFMISMILSPLHLIGLCDQLIIEPDINHQWHNANKTAVSRMVINRYITRHRYHRSCRNGHSVQLQNLYSLRNTRLCLYIGPWLVSHKWFISESGLI